MVAGACALDRLLGDPRGWFHPVQAMGWAIAGLRRLAEAWAGDRPGALRLAGLLIALAVTASSALAGLAIERLALELPLLGIPLLLAGLASALAGRSLEQAVRQVLDALPGSGAGGTALRDGLPAGALSAASGAAEGDGVVAGGRPPSIRGEALSGGPRLADDGTLEAARRRLAWIVGREVEHLDQPEILRALAETASENGVDGLFAPLFWMLVGAALWCAAPAAPIPGPLALAWLFKAASTLDSMLGYRRGRLRWLGTAGARLDDALTWLPCRLVALTLPLLAAATPGEAAPSPHPASPSPRGGDPLTAGALFRLRPLGPWRRFRRALREGAPDPSPNAGVSQAAYALAAGVRLGGVNRYQGQERAKPLLAAECAAADRAGVERMLALSRRLELAWLLAALPLLLALGGLAAAR